MNPKDEAFLEQLRAMFRIEAEEHIKTLSNELLALEKTIPQEEKHQRIEKIFREAHSLKGAARSVSQLTIQTICQVLEDVLSGWRDNHLSIDPAHFDRLYATIDLIQEELTQGADPDKIDKIIADLTSLKQIPAEKHVEPIAEKEHKPAPISTEKTIRISLGKLDTLFQEVEEMLMVKLTMQQEMEAQNELLKMVEKSDDPKKIHSFLSKMVKRSEINSHYVNSMVDTLLEDMKKILMQPISTLYEAFPRMVRDISKELGKEIQIEFLGGDIEVDRRILEELKDPIIHIIRNAIDHGIESPDERTKKQKQPAGKIILRASEKAGNTMELSISDDGRGVNISKIKEIAISKNLITQQEAQTLSQDEIIKLAFQSGISTSPIITDISGRGIGLGVVTEKIDLLGGRILVQTTPDKGTTFILKLPLTMATFRGVHITVENADFIMPAHNILSAVRIKKEEIKTIENYETITYNGHPVSYLRLADVLSIEKKFKKETKSHQSVLIVKAEEKIIAFGLDEIHREHEVLLKSLGSQCPRVKNIMAATIMDWGKVIPILNPIDLVRMAIKGEISLARSSAMKEKTKKKILLAEDSITTRLLLRNILESSGYEVKTAVDGQEAYEILQSNSFDLLLTDVEMPRMDGFSLTKKVREMASNKNLPIIICTARGSNEDREKGIECGANAYLDKNSFTQQSLVSIAQKLI